MSRVQGLCESRGGLPGLPVPNKPTVSVDVKRHFNHPHFSCPELKDCVKVKMAVLGSPSLIASVDVKIR